MKSYIIFLYIGAIVTTCQTKIRGFLNGVFADFYNVTDLDLLIST